MRPLPEHIEFLPEANVELNIDAPEITLSSGMHFCFVQATLVLRPVNP